MEYAYIVLNYPARSARKPETLGVLYVIHLSGLRRDNRRFSRALSRTGQPQPSKTTPNHSEGNEVQTTKQQSPFTTITDLIYNNNIPFTTNQPTNNTQKFLNIVMILFFHSHNFFLPEKTAGETFIRKNPCG